MRQFSQYLAFLFLFLVMAWFSLPNMLGVSYPKPPGPILDDQVRTHYKLDILQQGSEVVLLGDSSMDRAVDPELLSSLLDKKVYKIGFRGSASAVWYLIIKNNLLTSLYDSKTLVLFYRDTMLTIPDFRTNGDYFKFVDELANQHDELVVQLAYVNQMGWLEKQAEQYLPIYGERSTIRSGLEYWFKYSPSYWLFDYTVKDTDGATQSVFFNTRLDQEALNIAMTTAEDYLFEAQHFDFEGSLQQSFLPEIIHLCQKVGIQLIFVRMKTLYYASSEEEPPALQNYHTSLKNYLDENNIPLIDFNDNPRVSTDWFIDIIHFGEKGMTDFTEILAEELLDGLQ